MATVFPGISWIKSQDGTLAFPMCKPCEAMLPEDPAEHKALLMRLEIIARDWLAMDAWLLSHQQAIESGNK